jgi:hypothetical protein
VRRRTKKQRGDLKKKERMKTERRRNELEKKKKKEPQGNKGGFTDE